MVQVYLNSSSNHNRIKVHNKEESLKVEQDSLLVDKLLKQVDNLSLLMVVDFLHIRELNLMVLNFHMMLIIQNLLMIR